MSWPTDEMIDATVEVDRTPMPGATFREHTARAVAAALAAAPTTDGWVWCEVNGTVVKAGTIHNEHGGSPWDPSCPGPHRTLLLGPKVAS